MLRMVARQRRRLGDPAQLAFDQRHVRALRSSDQRSRGNGAKFVDRLEAIGAMIFLPLVGGDNVRWPRGTRACRNRPLVGMRGRKSSRAPACVRRTPHLAVNWTGNSMRLLWAHLETQEGEPHH